MNYFLRVTKTPFLQKNEASYPKEKLKTIGRDLSSLASIKSQENHSPSPISPAQNTSDEDWYFLSKIVPAKGKIKEYYFDRNFGFIKDAQISKLIYFKRDSLIDIQAKPSENLKDTSVVYTVVENALGLEAIYIHRGAKSTKDNFNLIHKLSSEKNLSAAKHILNHVIEAVGENRAVKKEQTLLDNSFLAAKTEKEKNNRFNKLYNNAANFQKNRKLYQHRSINEYDKAKDALAKHDFDLALTYFENCIKRDVQKESSIKDAASALAQAVSTAETDEKKKYYQEKAKSFLPTYEKHLPNTISTQQHFENTYYAVGDYENFLRVANLLLEDEKFTSNKLKQTTLMVKKAAALYRLNNVEQSLIILNAVLEIDPEHVGALKLKTAIENSNDPYASDNIETAISEAIQDSLVSGISPYITSMLADYEEYSGVATKVIESKSFDELTLKNIRNLINDTKGRSRDRAKFLLTEAKLMQKLEPDNISDFKSSMAKYCNDMAKNQLSQNNPMDVVRFFYNEAFALEESLDSTLQQVSYYMLTDCLSHGELLRTKNKDIDNAMELFFVKDIDMVKWNHLLEMLLYNKNIASYIIKKIFTFPKYKKMSVNALNVWGEKIDGSCNEILFQNSWDNVRKTRINNFKSIKAYINEIAKASNLEYLLGQWTTPLSKCKEEPWLCSLDRSRLDDILNRIHESLELFVKSTGYHNKETNYNNACGQLQSIMEEIKSCPTKLSYESILPLLEKAKKLLDDSFEDVLKASEPKLKIHLLSSNTVIEKDNQVSLQISISTDRNSSPIREVSVAIQDSDDVKYIPNDNTYSDSIEGGENQIFKLKVSVSPKVIQDKAVAFNAICRYKSRNIQKEDRSQLSLALYSPDEFEQIPNPYAEGASGGPLEPGKSDKMFYGRETFINSLIKTFNNSSSKQVIIYGQKRSGKSSVLNYLRQGLIDSGLNFCINFSMGEIVLNLSDVSFYHKILSTIVAELEKREIEGDSVPEFNLPIITEFEQEDPYNPANTFSKYLRKFKLACSKIEDWREKKLVVMIDEFTYLYTAIKKGQVSDSIMKQWKAITQNSGTPFSVVLVGQDVVPTFKKEEFAQNAFGVIEDIRLTYLAENDARNLITQPILDSNGNNRFIGNAVDRIIDYTSSNPYYIQIFCNRLVYYMNERKIVKVTEADVNDVAKTFIKGEQALEDEHFDNLISGGEADDLPEYPKKEILDILKNIAINTKNIPLVSREDINALEDKQRENLILQHLVDREVLKKEKNQYKIQVKLFQEWLLSHY